MAGASPPAPAAAAPLVSPGFFSPGFAAVPCSLPPFMILSCPGRAGRETRLTAGPRRGLSARMDSTSQNRAYWNRVSQAYQAEHDPQIRGARWPCEALWVARKE
jgi:hypothetical protein